MYAINTEDIKSELVLYIQKRSQTEVTKIYHPKKKKKKRRKTLLCPYAQIVASFSLNDFFCTNVKG